MKKLPVRFLVLALAFGVLPACATSASNVSSDDTPIMYRTIPERISDEAIENTAYQNLPTIAGVSQNSVRVGIDSFRRDVLLTGEVPTEQIKQSIEVMVQSIHGVSKVINHLTVTSVIKSQSHTVHENYIKSKIMAKVITQGTIRPSQYKIVVRNNIVYLMGILTATQEQQIINAMEGVQGIELVQLLNFRVYGSEEAIAMASAGMNIDDTNAQTANLVYGGVADGSNANSNTNPNTNINLNANNANNANSNVNNANVGANTNTAANKKAPIIYMEGNPTSGYVNLYNGTDKP